jgi:hypothetical protein
MNKKIIMPIALLTLIGLAVFVSALPNIVNTEYVGKNGDSPQGEDLRKVEYKIYKGWNLIPKHFFFYGSFGGNNLCVNNFKYGYLYDFEKKEYFGGKLQGVGSGSSGERTSLEFEDEADNERYFQLYDDYSTGRVNSMWVYSLSECSIKPERDFLFPDEDHILKRRDIDDFKEFRLNSGWNFFNIDFFKEGDPLEYYFSSCNVEKIAIWNPVNQDWYKVTTGEYEVNDFLSSTLVEPGFMFYPMLIKVENQCTLDYNPNQQTSSGDQPPTLPNGNTESEYVIFGYYGDYEYPYYYENERDGRIEYTIYYAKDDGNDAEVDLYILGSSEEVEEIVNSVPQSITEREDCTLTEFEHSGKKVYEFDCDTGTRKKTTRIWASNNKYLVVKEPVGDYTISNLYLNKYS